MVTASKTLRLFLRRRNVLSPNRFYCEDYHKGSSKGKSTYDERKFSNHLPKKDVELTFPPIPNIPAGVFRTIHGEHISARAYKDGCYQNPEYFSFHNMTFYDMHLYLRCYRNACAKTGRKPNHKGN